jgi:hypothetical protein
MSAVEEFHDACEDISEDKIVHFDITKYIIHRIDENKCLIKLTFKEFAMESVPWHYNRRINPEKVIELKEQLKVFDKETSPIWTVSLVFDKYTDKSKDDIHKYLKILDGQHRWQVIKDMIKNGEIKETDEIYATCYFINYCEGKNKNIATELFKKINNNTPLCIEDIPDTRVPEIIDRIIDDKVLNPNKEGIKTKDAQCTAHEPAIHKKELYNVINPHAKNFSNLSIDEIIVNIRLIRNKIMLTEFPELYRKSQPNQKSYAKAKSVDFWLGLKSSKKHSPEHWVLFINNPQEFGK